jgi:Rrf2 family protein
MKSPKTDELAVLFVAELAKRGNLKRVSLSDIATVHGVSMLYMKKIVRALKMADLVESKEGAGGGYVVSRSPNEISVWDVIASLKPKSPESIPLSKQYCPLNKSCLPQHINTKISQSVELSLKNISIQSLVA